MDKLELKGKKRKQVSGEDRLRKLLELGNEHRANNVANDTKSQDEDPNENNFFCNLPTSSYARVVIGADSGEIDMWSREGVLAQCHIDGVLRANIHFMSLCQTQMEHGKKHSSGGHKCCRSWSPANYVALLSNRSSCLTITETDLSKAKGVLELCAPYYHTRQLSPDCAEDFDCRRHLPNVCYTHDNAVYHLLHYLLDVNFIPPQVGTRRYGIKN